MPPPAERAARAAVILAAGLGTRMRSSRAKVLHPLGGLPLVTWCVRAVRPLVGRVVVVVGHEREAVQAALADEGVVFAVQDPPRGTGHALSCAASQVADVSRVVVLAGDVPRLSTESLLRALAQHEANAATATVMTFRPAEVTGYGRIARDESGAICAIVEEKQASADERRIGEVNSGLYVFESADVLPRLRALPQRGHETYLTDVVQALVKDGRRVDTFELAEDEVAGINSQHQLAEAERRFRLDRAAALMASGVTLVDAASCVIEADVEVGAGTILRPLVALSGRTRVGERCDVGPLVRLEDATLGEGCVVRGPRALVGRELPPGTTLDA